MTLKRSKKKLPISVTVLAKNSASTIEKVLESLKQFDEVVLWDTGSLDETIEIGQKFSNVVIYQKPFIGFGPTHNAASKKALHDWILSIDSDEILSCALIQEINSLSLEKDCVYSIPRKNFYQGQWIKGCGWYPDRVFRLYHRQNSQFSDDLVHETVITKNKKTKKLKNPLLHTSYQSTQDFLRKMDSYSSLFAEKSTKKSSLSTAIFHALFAFFKSYFLKRGILDGKNGFIISIYQMNTAFYKYLKLMDKQSEKPSPSDQAFYQK